MSELNELNIDEIIDNIVEITVPRYTLKAWKKLELGTDEDWRFETIPKKIYDFVQLQEIKEYKINPELRMFQYKIVVIDDDFFEWADKNNIEYSTLAVAEYIHTVSDDKAVELLERNHMNIERVLGTLLVFANLPESVSKRKALLKDDTINAATEMLMKEFGSYEKITVPGCVLLPKETYVLYDDFIDYEYEQETLLNKELLIKDISDINRPVPFLIPFMVDFKTNGCRFNFIIEKFDYDVQKDFLYYATTDRKYAKETKKFNKNDFCLKVKRDLGLDDFYVVPESIDFLASEEFVSDFFDNFL